MILTRKSIFENIVRKVENPVDQITLKHCEKRKKCWYPFSPFPTMLFTLSNRVFDLI